MPDSLTHINKQNNPEMVNVSDKVVTERMAKAQAIVYLPQNVRAAIHGNKDINSPKGPVLHTAIIAGTQAVKRTHELIPFCHPLPTEGITITISPEDDVLIINCEVTCTAKTGVEMEALTGASIAALTVYDMCKAMSHSIVIRQISLLEKTGGKSDFHGEKQHA